MTHLVDSCTRPLDDQTWRVEIVLSLLCVGRSIAAMGLSPQDASIKLGLAFPIAIFVHILQRLGSLWEFLSCVDQFWFADLSTLYSRKRCYFLLLVIKGRFTGEGPRPRILGSKNSWNASLDPRIGPKRRNWFHKTMQLSKDFLPNVYHLAITSFLCVWTKTLRSKFQLST